MIREINGKTLSDMFISGANNLLNYRQKVDEMNVFPVPDGDTGTNMSMTMKACIPALQSLSESSVYDVVKSVANDTLRGARGNSGVILSQLMRGMKKAFEDCAVCDTVLLAKGFKSASDFAYRAVMKPTEGTILTIAREISECAVKCSSETEDILDFFALIIDAGNKALEKTPDMLPKLKAAGVVDSGGQGLMYIAEGMYYFLINGKPVELNEITEDTASSDAYVDEEEITFAYCTECIVEKQKKNKSAIEFKSAIESIGDSMVFVDDDDIVKVHIHTNTPNIVLEEALKIGVLSSVKIENMRIQHSNLLKNDSENKKNENIDGKMKKYAFASVCVGSGIKDVLVKLGVDRIIEGGQTMNPSTDDIYKSIKGINAETIFVFPNNKNIIMAAELAKDLCDRNVIVIPTTAVTQSMSCMTYFDEELSPEENEDIFKNLIGEVKSAQITNAVRDTSVDGIDIKKGEYISIVDGKIKSSNVSLDASVYDAVKNMADDQTGVITLFYGCDVDSSDAKKIKDELEKIYDECDVSLYSGGQPVYYYLISCE